MGIQTVLNTVNFDAVLAGADMVFTGEGKLDSQSLRGKVVAGVAGRAKAQGVPVTVLVGGAEDPAISAVYEMGVTSVFPINRLPQDFSVSRKHSADNLAYTMDNILRLLAHRP
jgi:glycerate kinase